MSMCTLARALVLQYRRRAFALACLLGLAGARAFADPTVETLALANGLTATIYPADYLRERVDTEGVEPVLRLDDGRLIPVIVDINDPSIHNKGDGSFHPFSTAEATPRCARSSTARCACGSGCICCRTRVGPSW
jgi:hypothetical protein